MPQPMYENVKNYPLHNYGKGPFCKFKINKNYSKKTGVYTIFIDGDLKYVGECDDLFKRFNMGYGNISPRNCFEGGQPTNCRINSSIMNHFKQGLKIDLYFFETNDRFKLEHELIKKYNPKWNLTLGKPSKIGEG